MCELSFMTSPSCPVTSRDGWPFASSLEGCSLREVSIYNVEPPLKIKQRKKYKVTVSAALTEKITVIQARHHKRFRRFAFRATTCGVFINIVFAETKRWEVTYLERSKRVP